ncbi:protein FAM92A isoform X1 [Microtus ochrogaster]|uniref:Protein FAM92A isoform X1 n=1 Tax=Microtus ochrogaster TaxID=79684 RepID=A0ABM1AS75_MICOH|nr:protein FAM92A isoform X1 [Microtus ochrogaster]
MPSGLPCPALDRRGARRVATETPGRRGGAHGALSPPGRSGGGSLSRAPWRPGAALVGLPPRVLGGAQGKMLRRNLEDRDAQTKQLQDAVTNVEKHFGELCQIFAAYVRKTARLRDKADLLVNEINLYASTETPNLKQGLKNFADEFAKLQDYRQAEVERLEAKVVEPLKAYGTIVKMKRDDLKATLTARNREAKQLSQLERTRQRNPSDRHVISQVGNKMVCQEMDLRAETELQRATIDATRTSRHLEETIDNFEKQKIKDIKNIFSEFITIEMLFHGKALEVFTAAYQNIQKIDEDEDLEVFRNSLYLPDYPSRLDIVRANSKSPLQRSVSTKCTSGTGQITTCRTRKDQQVEDEDDEELDVTEDEN